MVKGEPVAPARSLEQARRALRADRRARHRAHGDGGFRCRGLGRAGASPPGCRWRACSAASQGPFPPTTSCGLGLMESPDVVADEAEKLLAGGFRAVKLRLGYPTLQQDLAALRAVKKRIGDGIAVMVDYNQAPRPGGGARARPRARRGRHLLARGADPPRRLCRLRGARARARDADPDRREFFESGAMAAALAAGASRLRHAGSRAHRRRDRLAARCRARRSAPHQDVIASLSGSERASCWPQRRPATPRICRLGGRHSG